MANAIKNQDKEHLGKLSTETSNFMRYMILQQLYLVEPMLWGMRDTPYLKMPTREQVARNLGAAQVSSEYKYALKDARGKNWTTVVDKMVK